MKKILATILLGTFSIYSAQSVSDYQFVLVPKKFKSFKEENQYDLNNILISKLKEKNYTTFHGEESLPESLKNNPCSYLRAEILDNSSLLKNKMKLEFYNCEKQTVSSIASSTSIKDFDAGFKNALQTALKSVPTSSPKELASIETTPTPSEMHTKVQNETKNTEKEKITVRKKDVEIFYNAQKTFNKINLTDKTFILVHQGSSSAYAQFSETFKEGVYRVKLENNFHTIGYLENGNIVIEMPKNNSSEVFEKIIFTTKP